MLTQVPLPRKGTAQPHIAGILSGAAGRIGDAHEVRARPVFRRLFRL